MKTKTLLFTIVCISVFSTLKSQDINSILKGKRVVGGGINVSLFNDEFEPDPGNPTQSQISDRHFFSFRPYAGKFIKDRLLLGGELFISFRDQESRTESQSYLNTTEQDEFNVGLGVFLRKYYPIVGKFGAFIQPELNFRVLNNESKNSIFDNSSQEVIGESSIERDGFQTSVGIDLGLYIFLGERFSLETNLGNIAFSHTREDQKRRSFSTSMVNNDDRKVNDISINLVNQISFDQLFVINYFF